MSFYRYKQKKQDFHDDDPNKRVLMYRVFSAQVMLIASLINATPDKRGDILWDPLTSDLLVVVTHGSTDPVLLHAVCYLANQVLTGVIKDDYDESKTNKVKVDEEMNNIITRMQHCEKLLPYMGFLRDLGGQGDNQFRFLLREM